jgi:putative thioredoxin
VQGIPAVKAFRDGAIVNEFVGAVPKAQVEALFDSLVPSRADELLAAGDELSLREAAELEPRRADIAVALARKRLERGAEEDALAAVEGHDALLDALAEAGRSREGEEHDDLREQLRRAIIGILSEAPPDDPTARGYRRHLATALY